MLSLPSSVRIFLAVEPVDMRGSFDALAGAARRLGLAPEDGHIYRFRNRRRVGRKLLFFEGGGSSGGEAHAALRKEWLSFAA
jgi:transposase